MPTTIQKLTSCFVKTSLFPPTINIQKLIFRYVKITCMKYQCPVMLECCSSPNVLLPICRHVITAPSKLQRFLHLDRVQGATALLKCKRDLESFGI